MQKFFYRIAGINPGDTLYLVLSRLTLVSERGLIVKHILSLYSVVWLLVFLCTAPGRGHAAPSTWVEIYETVFFDAENIVINKDTSSVWIKASSSGSDLLSLHEMNCSKSECRTIDQLLKRPGKPDIRIKSNMKWSRIVPKSLDQDIYRLVCRKEDPAAVRQSKAGAL